MPLALFGIDNDGLNTFVNLLVLFLVVVWFALIAWTNLDARRRIEDPVLVLCATAASLFPFVGTVVYAILRPPEYLEDARERQLETRATELRVRQLEDQSCATCGYPIERTFLRCPSCRNRVNYPCESCGKPIDPRWSLCPYCETPVRRAAPEPRRATRERESARATGPKARQPAAAPRTARTAGTARTGKQRQSGRPVAGGRRDGPGEDRPRPATAR